MKFILLLLIAILAIYIIYIYYTNEQSKLKHKLVVAAQHNEKLKKELSKNKIKNLSATFSKPLTDSGILDEGINIYLAPFNNSWIINKSSSKMQVNILDECNLSDITWFYVTLPLDSNLNSHGWVKKNDFLMLCSSCQDIEPL